MKKLLLSTLFFSLLWGSCTPPETKTIPPSHGGIALSFDDNYVDEWVKIDELLSKYQWKATFYITKPHLLHKDHISKLHYLQDKGHELGAHGYFHFNALEYYNNNKINEYLKTEIDAELKYFKRKKFRIKSFSYPYGAHNEALDSILSLKFSTLRTTTYGIGLPKNQSCFYNKTNIIEGIGIDNHYPHHDMSYFFALLKYAKLNNKIVQFYAHKPVEKAVNKLEIDYEVLQTICEYAQREKMTFYTSSQLLDLKK